MNASRARRRWIKWCRYVDKTQSSPDYSRNWGSHTHNGQARAFQDLTFAGRAYPRGARYVRIPTWGVLR